MSDLKGEFVEMKLSDIVPYDRNPRINKDAVDRVLQSLKEHGQVRPLVLSAPGKPFEKPVVCCGHTTLKALKKFGAKTAKVQLHAFESEKQFVDYNIRDNKTSEFAEWDETVLLELANDFQIDLKELEFEFEMDEEPIEGLTDEDEVPEPPEEPTAKLGQMWKLGEHRLMCGDSTDRAQVERLMGGEKADMVFTDPPYGVSYNGGHNRKKRDGIIADTLQGDNLTGLFHSAISNAIIITHDHAPFYVWYASGKSVETFASLSELPLNLRAVIQWYKVNSGLGAFMSQYIPNCEPCMYLFKTGKSPAWYGPTDEKTVWELKKEVVNDFHPTQKPIELPERAINNSSKHGDVVIDLFGGSGSTLIACEKTGRKCRMMELDNRYVDVIIQRWCDFTGIYNIECDGKPYEWKSKK